MAQKIQGLTTEQATERLSRYGLNVTKQPKRNSFVKKFFSQFGDLMIIILIVAAVLSFVIAIISGEKNEILEPIIIVVIVLVNAFLGAFQEFRAQKSLDALKQLTAPKTNVLRDSQWRTIDSSQLVVGDVCRFEAGDIVTADCTLLLAEGCFVNQSALTGESIPVEKSATSNTRNNHQNRLFSGSFVTKGRCVAQVISTGAHTELGKIADALADAPTSLTPLQQKLKQLSKVIGIVCLSVCFAVLIIGFIKGVKQMRPGDTVTSVFVNVFLTSVSLAVAAIPEGLPAVVTVVLAKGIEKMAAKNAVVKRLTAVEALGSATVICSDKTGTLTQNKMTLVGMFDGNYHLAQNLSQNDFNLQCYCWCCDAILGENGWIGDPTEIAVTQFAQNVTPVLRLYEIPFDSDRKLMTVVVKYKNKYYAITKGSPEAMSSAHNYSRFQKQCSLYTQKGLRVLALSVREVQHSFPRTPALEQNLNITALFTITDPPRPQALPAVATCKSAGIRPVMITGDNLDTASEIARNLGIMGHDDIAVDGDILQSWNDQQLKQNVQRISVYARVTPSDKLRIVSAWKSCNAVVAMTGDGVNDAPALKTADIGCAMGSGTEVAKEASDIILTDDNFATIVDAVSLGRSVYQNIKKSVTYLLTCNIGEVLSVFVALLIWNISPFSAMQLLWINLVTDGLPGLALGIYKQESDVMNRPPKPTDENFFSGGNGWQITMGGLLFAIVTLIGYGIGNKVSPSAASTMAFVILSVSQLFFVLELRSNQSIFKGGITAFMAVAFLLSVALVAVVTFLPPMQRLFDLAPLSGAMYLFAVGLSLVPTAATELFRLIKKNPRKQK